ncbi:hypothetical protein U1Q18_025565, partial [Sarracenia purpurea var. burkii]
MQTKSKIGYRNSPLPVETKERLEERRSEEAKEDRVSISLPFPSLLPAKACKEEEDSAMCRDEKGICDTKDGQMDMSSSLLSAEAFVPVGSVT